MVGEAGSSHWGGGAGEGREAGGGGAPDATSWHPPLHQRPMVGQARSSQRHQLSGGEKRAAAGREIHDNDRRQLPLPPLAGAARPLSPCPSFPSVSGHSAHRPPARLRTLISCCSKPDNSEEERESPSDGSGQCQILETLSFILYLAW